MFVCIFVAAVRAAHTFYSATTLMKVKAMDRFGAPVIRKVKTKMLCQTTDPEEKRTIIGDTFMNVLPMFSSCNPRIDFSISRSGIKKFVILRSHFRDYVMLTYWSLFSVS